MSFRRLTTVAAALCILAVTHPSQASASSVLTLQGSRTASIDITLSAQTTFDLEHVTTSGSGRFIGFYAEAIDRPPAPR